MPQQLDGALLEPILKLRRASPNNSREVTEEERRDYLAALDQQLAQDGANVPEWCVFLTKETDAAFAKGVLLAAIIMALAGIETYLRSKNPSGGKAKLYELIDQSPIKGALKRKIHRLRDFRNKWVHVEEPWSGKPPPISPRNYRQQLERMAKFAVKTLRQTIYEAPHPKPPARKKTKPAARPRPTRKKPATRPRRARKKAARKAG